MIFVMTDTSRSVHRRPDSRRRARRRLDRDARDRGADVILVDKGYCGTTGATAPSGTGVWYVSPDPAHGRPPRRAGKLGGNLADHEWMDRVLDRTYENMHFLGDEGRYPFPLDAETGHRYPHRRAGTGIHAPHARVGSTTRGPRPRPFAGAGAVRRRRRGRSGAAGHQRKAVTTGSRRRRW